MQYICAWLADIFNFLDLEGMGDRGIYPLSTPLPLWPFRKKKIWYTRTSLTRLTRWGIDEAVKLLSMLKKNWLQNHSTGHGYMHILLAVTPFSGFHSIQDPNSKSASRILPSSRPIYLKYRMLVFTNGDYVLSFSKQRDTSLQQSGLNFHTTISKQISIGSSKSMKFAYQTESQPIHWPIVVSVRSMSISYRFYKTRGQ